MSKHVFARRGLVGSVVAGLVATPLAVGFAAPASADVSAKISSFPYVQDWSDAGLITADDNWSGVPGVQGYTATAGAAAGSDPQLFVADTGTTDVIANQAATTTSGGVIEVQGSSIAIQGSNGAPIPYVAFHLDLSSKTGATFAFNAKDLDVSGDNAVQPIAVQYRIGGSGNYTNLPDGYIADATDAGSATKVTPKSVPLPASTDNQSSVFVRVLTVNAAGSDELVGIDDINITAGGGTAALSAANPGSQSATVGQPFSLQLQAAGGSGTYTWTTSALPAGLTLSGNTISGTPTAQGTTPVTATVNDGASTATTTFDIVVAAAQAVRPVAEIQGPGATTPFAGQQVTTEGVVTAVYPTGGLNGFYIQTGGVDTPDASDGIFVYGGTSGFSTYPEVGSTVRVSGTANEFNTVTQITANDAGVTPAATAQPAVVPQTVLPGADCELGTCPSTADLSTLREKHEGEAFRPTAAYTVTDTYDGSAFTGSGSSSSMFGEVGLAAHSTSPLFNVTEVVDASDTAGLAARTAYNNAHRVLLDDGATLNYATNAGETQPFPYYTPDHTVRVGAGVTFDAPAVLTYSFGAWRFQPQKRVVGAPTGLVTFEQDRPALPEDVGGDLKLATFNVLNYFTTFGERYADVCGSYKDRNDVPVTTNCPNGVDGPRGAWDQVNFERQQAKIVDSINKLDADVVSLEEIENTTKLNPTADRDETLAALVTALNAAAPGDEARWAFVDSPADGPAVAEEDFIRTAFIYNPQTVALVGPSRILTGNAAFDDAREPLAQVFKAKDADDQSGFVVVVNHFKSKRSGTPDAVQGAGNAERVQQANALVAFAEDFASDRGVERIFLTGDFNAYSMEDPVQAIEGAGYTKLESDEADERSYNFDGAIGSLDHIFANEVASADVTGVDIWTTNAYESVYYEYSRYNYNVTNLYAANPYRASDHNPEIVGIDVPAGPATVNLLNINDFHGRIDANTTRFATTVEQLRAEQGEGNTLLLSAGDNIGASLFASAVQDDDPTLDVLDALDLRTSAVGNHEFDQGFSDLQDDVKPDVDFSYLGANVYTKGTTTPALQEYDTFEVDGVTVGVIGAVTQETPTLVSPAGVATLDFGDPVAAVNRVAAQLSDGNAANGEADVIVAEYHEGAGSALPDTATCAQEIASDTVFGRIARETAPSVDVIFTGHTHKEYACDAPVPGVAGKTRPILQTGSYGDKVGQVVLTVDRTTGDVSAYTQRNVARSTTENLALPRVAEVKRITDAALAFAAEKGNQPVGRITGDITRAFAGGTYGPNGYAGGTTDDRSSESTLGDLVANALRDGVSDFATPDLGVTNPGGLRSDLLFAGNTGGAQPNPANTDGVVTFAEANAVLPFNNTVAVVQLKGADLKEVLEQQWQTAAAGQPAPSRLYLQLGLSDNVRVTADPTKPAGERITSVFIDDEPLDPARTYTVSTLSFLAAGGDNFRAFAKGKAVDTGLLDAQMWRDYLADNSPVSPDFARQQVFESGKPAQITGGQRYQFQLGLGATTAPVQPLNPKTLNLTSLGSPANTQVVATVGGTQVGTFPVTNGIALIDLTVPTSVRQAGYVTFVAQPSGTTVTVPFVPGPSTTTVAGTSEPVVLGEDAVVEVTVTSANDTGAEPTGTVTLSDGATEVATGELVDGAVSITVPAAVLEVGDNTFTLSYEGDADHQASTGTVTVEVDKATTSVTAAAVTVTYGQTASVPFEVTSSSDATAVTGTVTLKDGDVTLGSTTIDNGTGAIELAALALPAGTHTLDLEYSGDATAAAATGTVQVTVAKAASTTTATVTPSSPVVRKDRTRIAVTVTAEGYTPTGDVELLLNGTKVGQGTLTDGAATVTVGPWPKARAYDVEVRYVGDANTQPSTDTVRVAVGKQRPTLSVAGPAKVRRGAQPTLTATVKGIGGVVTGQVRFRYLGKAVVRSLNAGKASLKLARLTRTTAVTVTYLGTADYSAVTRTKTIKVTR